MQRMDDINQQHLKALPPPLLTVVHIISLANILPALERAIIVALDTAIIPRVNTITIIRQFSGEYLKKLLLRLLAFLAVASEK